MKIKTTILLVRHAEYDATLNPNDPLLSAEGRESSEKLAQWLKQHYKIDALYASPLARARETAEIINLKLGLKLVIQDELKEFDIRPLLPQFPELFNANDALGKSHHVTLPREYWAFAERVFQSFREIVETHQNKIILIVAHGHVIGTIVRSLLGGHRMAIHSEPTGVTQLQHWDDSIWEIDFLNRREHLR
jgi:probable phosphoglycerate mutase